MTLDETKPHRGTIEAWFTGLSREHDEIIGVVGRCVSGDFDGPFLTTTIRAQEGTEIETLNWRFTLGEHR